MSKKKTVNNRVLNEDVKLFFDNTNARFANEKLDMKSIYDLYYKIDL